MGDDPLVGDGPLTRAPVLVLLPAAGRGPGLWRDQVAALSGEFRVLTPSLGDTAPAGEFTVALAAQRVAALIAAEPDGVAAVCGISLGAFVALQLAADHPQRVRSLVLSGGQVHPSRAALTLNHAVLRLLPARTTVFDGGSKQALLRSYRTLFDWDGRPLLRRVTAPTLVLCGARDRANLGAARSLAAGIPHARLEVVPGAGHLWNLSHPQAFAAALRGFVR